MLRQFFSLLLVLFVTVGLVMHDAEAKRFGGGRSFGAQRSTSSFNRSAYNPGSAFTQNNSAFNQPRSTMSRWLGPLAGFAAGGLLASLFMHNGIGSGMISWLLIGGLLLLVFNLFRSRMQPSTQPKYDDYRNQFAHDAAAQFRRNSSGQAQAATSNVYPIGFDSAAFIRDAKVLFIRLQAAYDQKNLEDLRTFTTPEVYAEIQMQFQERGNENNKTDVVTLEGELLDVMTEPQIVANTQMEGMVASVRFSGLIQENRNEPAASFNEVWHFKKEVANSRWLVAGVQQS